MNGDYIDSLIGLLKKESGDRASKVKPLVDMHAECEQQVSQVLKKEAAQTSQFQELYRYLGSTLLRH